MNVLSPISALSLQELVRLDAVLQQVVIALSDTNRYFASEKLGKWPNDVEAVKYFFGFKPSWSSCRLPNKHLKKAVEQGFENLVWHVLLFKMFREMDVKSIMNFFLGGITDSLENQIILLLQQIEMLGDINRGHAERFYRKAGFQGVVTGSDAAMYYTERTYAAFSFRRKINKSGKRIPAHIVSLLEATGALRRLNFLLYFFKKNSPTGFGMVMKEYKRTFTAGSSARADNFFLDGVYLFETLVNLEEQRTEWPFLSDPEQDRNPRNDS